MSERVTAEALRSAAKARRTVADGDYAGKLMETAADTIAALERERDEAMQELTLWQRAFGPYPLKQLRGGE